MSRRYFELARKAFGRPPGFVVRRAMQEVRAQAERFLSPRRARQFGGHELLSRTGAVSIDELWNSLAARPYVCAAEPITRAAYEALCPGDGQRIFAAAERALTHRVDLLGSGDVHLGERIDWHKDYKSGHRWESRYCRDIDYLDAGRPSDVKFPWEVSRMQWLIPAGQAYLLGGNEIYAQATRRILEDWMESNPFAASVNWGCAMEAALRILSWTWFFHVFSRSAAWADENFRIRFLCSLYLHADFTDRYFEIADVSNHTDADAAGLVFAGLFFCGKGEPGRWLERGWKVLNDELDKQVSADGVDYEGSIPYHRLVTELFFLPALYRRRLGLPVSEHYAERLRRMAEFTEAYTCPDGSAPCVGDADDGRALPFGAQPINDHRYLLAWVGTAFNDPQLTACFSGDRAECLWLLGPEACRSLGETKHKPTSTIFREGGYAILRNERDHVFVDCAPVGMAGRGGHGHNDVLSCEVVLLGCRLIGDCGAYVYSADYEARNRFRSTASHNTPRVDGEEINRFVRPDLLWWLHDDAKPEIRAWETGADRDLLTVAHSGYRRLASPVTPVRTYVLEHNLHSFTIRDEFEGTGEHRLEIPMHLAPGTSAEKTETGATLNAGNCSFRLEVGSPGWALSIEPTEVSPSYGIRQAALKLVWRRSGPLSPFAVRLAALNSQPFPA